MGKYFYYRLYKKYLQICNNRYFVKTNNTGILKKVDSRIINKATDLIKSVLKK